MNGVLARRNRLLALALIAQGCSPLAGADLGDRIAAAAAELAATRQAYVVHALGGPAGPEYAGLPTTGLDCMTFVEAALLRAAGLSQSAEQQRWLRLTRYDGHAPAYCSRAHYLSDWAERNGRRAWLADLTAELAAASGAPLHAHAWKRSWMAEHGLDPAGCIAAAGSSSPIEYIAPGDYARVVSRILPGDILAFVARAPGLDHAHLAIAEPHGGLAMASSLSGHTLLKPDWQAYARAQTGFLGVRVLRVRSLQPD